MRKVCLFIAMSLDGYIADDKGSVDFLTLPDNGEETRDTYGEFVENVDTVIMGYKTYDQIVHELSPTQWVYEDLTSYVITHRQLNSRQNVIFTCQSPCDLVRSLVSNEGKDIFICGGANIISQLMQEDLIDYYYITIIPTLLGTGISLFAENKNLKQLKLLKVEKNNEMVDLVYVREK